MKAPLFTYRTSDNKLATTGEQYCSPVYFSYNGDYESPSSPLYIVDMPLDRSERGIHERLAYGLGI